MEKEKPDIKVKFSSLFIHPIAMKKIRYYADAAKGEVSGMGTITIDAQGRHIVDEVYLLEQKSTAGDTEIEPESLSKLMTDLITAGKDTSKLKFWWHSHATMGVFWSSTDDACCDTLSREYAYSMVVNKAGDKKCRLDVYSPFRFTMDNLRVEELTAEDDDLKKICFEEVKEKVKEPSYSYTQPSNGYSNPHQYQDDFYGGYNSEYPYSGRGGGRSRYDEFHFKRSGVNTQKDLATARDEKSKVKLPINIVTDIIRLLDTAADHEQSGGILCADTWSKYILDTLRQMSEDRWDKKAECGTFGVFNPQDSRCTNTCKVRRPCAVLSMVFKESEEDAARLAEEQKKDDGKSLEVVGSLSEK